MYALTYKVMKLLVYFISKYLEILLWLKVSSHLSVLIMLILINVAEYHNQAVLIAL